MPSAPGKSLWSGAISFGIVSIPVALHAAVREQQLHFHQVSRSKMVRIRHQLVADGTSTVVPASDIVRAFEIEPEQYVPIEDDELKRLAAEKSRTIDIAAFVALAEIDPLYFDSSYWLVPDAKAQRAYDLLHTAMRDSGRVAIAHFVMRNKEILAAIRPLEKGLCLDTMHYDDEVVAFATVAGALTHVTPKPKELEIAASIIDSMSGSFKPEQYHDSYRERVLAFLKKKAVGHTESIPEDRPAKPGKILDLMAALEASLGKVRAGHAGAAASSARRHAPAGERSGAARPRARATARTPSHVHARSHRKKAS